ncbi:MAG TPA: hypothetical protein VNU26_03625 [Mycobacteriales bacterium]|nr:hypothetical protein [Mycobacteriales bacterium]
MSKRHRAARAAAPRHSPAAAQLRRYGWSRRDAELLAGVDDALATIRTADAAVGESLAEYVAQALCIEPVLCGARALYTAPEHAPGWRALAAFLEQPVRKLLLDLAAEADGYEVSTTDELGFSAEDLRLTDLAVRAQNRGDFTEALCLLRSTTRPLDDAWVRDLERLIAAEEVLTPHEWGRWLCNAALHWAQSTERGLRIGLHYASVALRALGASEEVVTEHAPRRAGYDQIVHDALLWDDGALQHYIETELAPGLLRRVPGFEDWPAAPLSVVRLLGSTETGDAECEDVLDGRRRVVGDGRLAEQHPPGRLFTGRLVQVTGDDRWFFAMRPTVCDDPETALLLAHAVADGAVPEDRVDLQHRWMRQEPAA